jgi:hypothetical protein
LQHSAKLASNDDSRRARQERNEVYLRLEGITKSLPGVIADSGIRLEAARGEMHAILDEHDRRWSRSLHSD